MAEVKKTVKLNAAESLELSFNGDPTPAQVVTATEEYLARRDAKARLVAEIARADAQLAILQQQRAQLAAQLAASEPQATGLSVAAAVVEEPVEP